MQCGMLSIRFEPNGRMKAFALARFRRFARRTAGME